MATDTPTSILPTREQYEQRRKKYIQQLVRSVHPTVELLLALADIEAFKDKVSDIRSMKKTKEKAEKLLSLPESYKYKNTIGPYLSVLKENGHEHVANVFIAGSNEDLLTDENYRLLRDKLADLCTYMDPECGIVVSLISAGVFDECDEDWVKAQNTTDDKAREIFKILSRKSNYSYSQFLDILEERDQGHIVHILTGNGSPPISKENLDRINVERKNIIDNILSMHTPFVDALVSKKVFTDVDRQRVEAMKVRYQRNEEILNILTRKSESHLDKFIEVLNEMHHEHVAELFASELLAINGMLHVRPEVVERELLPHLQRDLEDAENDMCNAIRKHGIHEVGVANGSIRIWFKFLTRKSLDVIRSDIFDTLFTNRYRALLSDKGLQSIDIKIPEEEYERCEQIIRQRKALMTPEHQYALELAKENIADQIYVDEDLLKNVSLCRYCQDVILNQNSGDKAKILLEVIACRPDCEFQQLVKVLRRKQQNVAADFLMRKNIYLFVWRHKTQVTLHSEDKKLSYRREAVRCLVY